MLLPSVVLFGKSVVALMPSVTGRFVVENCGNADVLLGTGDWYSPVDCIFGTIVGGDVEVVDLSSTSGAVVSGQSLAVPELVVFILVTLMLVSESVVGLFAVVSGVPGTSS